MVNVIDDITTPRGVSIKTEVEKGDKRGRESTPRGVSRKVGVEKSKKKSIRIG